MHPILVLGAGRIGTLIARWLESTGDYSVWLADITKPAVAQGISLDAAKPLEIADFLKNQPAISTIISCLPYYHNPVIVDLAKQFQLNYFDLTEDRQVVRHIQTVAQGANRAFVPQCGLAPGFVNIAAVHLIQSFQQVEKAKLRVGALPVTADNALHYALTWSTDGLINQYGNPCSAIHNGQIVELLPLEGLEILEIDGQIYEAFNTSGGLGSLADNYIGKIPELDYKTLRYPGHCEKIRFLMNDLKLNTDRTTLKYLLERALPKIKEDMVIVYISVQGQQSGEYIEQHYTKKFYGQEMLGSHWSAIQLTTAAGVCSVVDEVLSHPSQYSGYITQERFDFTALLQNRFGRYFAE